ncbi:MAG TPA: hypothetical protein PLK12_13750, partial [Prolixibacteraceae bacterium]|nr:hypothetical protein [Prolixibacteraceae bacterium]
YVGAYHCLLALKLTAKDMLALNIVCCIRMILKNGEQVCEAAIGIVPLTHGYVSFSHGAH